jgi:hypothetical protein
MKDPKPIDPEEWVELRCINGARVAIRVGDIKGNECRCAITRGRC